MNMYDASVGACPPSPYPYGYPYAAAAPYGAASAYPLAFAGPANAQMSGWPHYDLVGQPAPPAPPEPGYLDTARDWLQQETLGVKRQNLLLGAAAVSGIWYAYSQGWLGAMGGGRARARDFGFRF